MASCIVILMSTLMMAISVQPQLTQLIHQLVPIVPNLEFFIGITVCNRYAAVQKEWNELGGTCFIRRSRIDGLKMSCGYSQINYAGERPPGTVPTGVSFLTAYDKSTGNTTVYSYNWIKGGQKGIVTQLCLETNQYSITSVVVATEAGYCFIGCPVASLTLTTEAISTCSLPDSVYCCTFNQIAPESVVEQLMLALEAKGVSTYGVTATDQSSCPKTVQQYTATSITG